jgi:hypothetical protein
MQGPRQPQTTTLHLTITQPQYGMPTTLWPPTSSTHTMQNTSLSFQPQLPHPSNYNPWSITTALTYYHHTNPPNTSNPHPYQAYTTYTQPSPYIPNQYQYYQQTPNSTTSSWTRSQLPWPELSNPQSLYTTYPPQPNHQHQTDN